MLNCETVIFDDRDPPWIANHIKKAIKDKNLAFNRFVKNKGSVNNNSNLEKSSSLQNNFNSLIETFSKTRIFLKNCQKFS